ncbi:MAG: L,D-transpeptidase family protein [Desulfatiglandales bacterium]
MTTRKPCSFRSPLKLMMSIVPVAVALLCGTFNIPCPNAGTSNLSIQIGEILARKITTSSRPQNSACRKGLLCGPESFLKFYTERAFRPAWSGDQGPLTQAADLVKELHGAVRHGLEPRDYHLADIEGLLYKTDLCRKMGSTLNPDHLADLDLLLTDAFLLYASDLLTGRVDPETIQPGWSIKGREADCVTVLRDALETDGIETALQVLSPQHDVYMGLKEALLQYRGIKEMGGWSEISPGPKMETGDQGLRVSALRSRLIVSGDREKSLDEDNAVFDEELERAVRKFQERHGLTVDGVVGPATLRAINVPADERIHQIISNMERWRWLPQTLGPRYVLVNIANFELTIVENGLKVMTMPVVVGRDYRHTPVFTGEMTYIELNPYWHIPRKIAREDILPKVKKDPAYLAGQGIRVFESWDDDAEEIAPEAIDWSRVDPHNLTFKFRQDPGPTNGLGRVKFMFPNKYEVYLHDTPEKALFKKVRRNFSSGCIRVERPVDLLVYLLRDDPRWRQKDIIEVLERGETQIIKILKPIPVYLLYWTAWSDPDGRVHFREDIYGRDTPLIRALLAGPPPPDR